MLKSLYNGRRDVKIPPQWERVVQVHLQWEVWCSNLSKIGEELFKSLYNRRRVV